MNGYEVEAAIEAKRVLQTVPLAKEVRIVVKGIVGGDFTVIASQHLSGANTPQADMLIEIKR